jgi:hypothetical protein
MHTHAPDTSLPWSLQRRFSQAVPVHSLPSQAQTPLRHLPLLLQLSGHCIALQVLPSQPASHMQAPVFGVHVPWPLQSHSLTAQFFFGPGIHPSSHWHMFGAVCTLVATTSGVAAAVAERLVMRLVISAKPELGGTSMNEDWAPF